jgi:hypothetical protein
VRPNAQGCEVCLQMGDARVHLREYLTCGHVGWCGPSVSPRRRNALSFRATLSPDSEVSALALTTVIYARLWRYRPL